MSKTLVFILTLSILIKLNVIEMQHVQASEENVNKVSNASFETMEGTDYQDPIGWIEYADKASSRIMDRDDAYHGTRVLRHENTLKSYIVTTKQRVHSLNNGKYKLTAWVRSSGGQEKTIMRVLSYGGSEMICQLPQGETWKQVVIDDIEVTTQEVLVAFSSTASKGQWLEVDQVRLEKKMEEDEQSIVYECESLHKSTSGERQADIEDVEEGITFNNFEGDSIEDYVEYTINVATPGSYQVYIGDRIAYNKGIYQLSINGTQIGLPKDLYIETTGYRESNYGEIIFNTSGDQKIRMRVMGKNSESTDYQLGFDYIRLVPDEDIIGMDFNALMEPVSKNSVLKVEGYYTWGGSMARTEDGKCHLIFSMWPKETGFNGWVTHSVLGYAVADDPLGPYVYKGLALSGSGNDNWDADVIHNPTMIEYEGKYYLYYMGNKGNGQFWNNRNNQRIGVAVANHPSGPWVRNEEPVIDVSVGEWDHLMTSNPTVTLGPDGKVVMVYKGVGEGTMPVGGPVVCGVAMADHPLGPFEKVAGPIMTNPHNNWSVEDPFMWYQDDRYYALVKDFQGHFTKQGKNTVALFESNDAINWNPSIYPYAFSTEIRWSDGTYTDVGKLERPQLWLEDGVPKVLFCAVLHNGETYNVHIPLRSNEE